MSTTHSSSIEAALRAVAVSSAVAINRSPGASAMLQSLNVARGREVEKICWESASENGHKIIERPIPPISDEPTFPAKLAALPFVTYRAGETVIVDGSKTGRLLILRKGSVAIVKEDTEIARVAEPGAVFGELSVLLDQPHTADVRALETSQFHIANAATLLAQNPTAMLYIATVLAQRLNGANLALIQLKTQLQAGEPHSVVAKTVSNMQGLLGASGASLVYAGYPYDPLA